MPNQRRGYSAKKGAFWIQLIWTHPEPRKKREHTPHMGVHAHINIPIPITHTPNSKKHSFPHKCFPCKQPPFPSHYPSDSQQDYISNTQPHQLLTKVHGDTKMTPMTPGHLGVCFQCLANVIMCSHTYIYTRQPWMSVRPEKHFTYPYRSFIPLAINQVILSELPTEVLATGKAMLTVSWGEITFLC